MYEYYIRLNLLDLVNYNTSSTMKYETKEALWLHGAWCAPCVGTFESEVKQYDAVTSIGRISQLGRTYEVVLPAGQSAVTVLYSKSVVEYGTPLAKSIQSANTLDVSKQNTDRLIEITAPCDGFLQTVRSDGSPLFCKGAFVEPGQTIAVIELMKLGVDVIYKGKQTAKFVSYTSSTTVKCGECVAKVEMISDVD